MSKSLADLLDDIELKELKELKKQKETKELDIPLKNETEKKPKKPKKIALTDRSLTKEQTLDKLYSLGKESIGNLTISKLRSMLEDVKLYAKRK